MRRRRVEDTITPPERLHRFVPSEWVGSADGASRAWGRARIAWFLEHGWPGCTGLIDLLRLNRETRLNRLG